MTIRSGGGPRDDRSHARPADPGTYDEYRPGRDPWQPPGRRNRNRGHDGDGGFLGFLRFLAFTLVLAALVLAGLFILLRPLVSGAVVDWAYDNPGALRLPFVADLVRDELGDTLTEPASRTPSEVTFAVIEGDTVRSITPRLLDAGVIANERAFVFQATLRELGPQLREGNFRLSADMTPDEVVTGLIENRLTITIVPVTFRESLRLAQMTALIQTLEPPLAIDAQEFYELATNPPAELLDEYPWLRAAGLPEGASLEGFLGAATYDLTPESTAGDLIRMMLDTFERQVGAERMVVPESRGMTFYQIVTLASIVEREAVLDEERPLIAGVYQNRLSAGGATSVLGADPTVFYALDTVALDGLPFEEWRNYRFWVPPGVPLGEVTLPEALQGYQSYRVQGLPPGPIATPSKASIEAALAPDTADGYLYFLAIPNGNGAHAFAKTQAEHDQNRRKYGYL